MIFYLAKQFLYLSLRRKIKILKLIMNNQANGNTQLNSARNEHNDRVEVKSFLGKTKKVAWTGFRRFRSI